MNFIANNQEQFQTNSVVCNINSRNKYYIHRPMPASQVFRKHHTVLVSKDETVYYANLQLWIHTHCCQRDEINLIWNWKGSIWIRIKKMLNYTFLLFCWGICLVHTLSAVYNEFCITFDYWMWNTYITLYCYVVCLCFLHIRWQMVDWGCGYGAATPLHLGL
jgi:hypothetical protein